MQPPPQSAAIFQRRRQTTRAYSTLSPFSAATACSSFRVAYPALTTYRASSVADPSSVQAFGNRTGAATRARIGHDAVGTIDHRTVAGRRKGREQDSRARAQVPRGLRYRDPTTARHHAEPGAIDADSVAMRDADHLSCRATSLKAL